MLARCCRNLVHVHGEGGGQSVVARHILEGVGLYRTNITAVDKDGVDVVAVVRGDFDGHRLVIGDGGVGRGDGTAFARRCRHREFVNGKLCRNRVVAAYICKGVGVSDFNDFTVHKQAADMPACFRNDRIGDVFSAVHCGSVGRGDRAVLARCCRNLVHVHGEGGGQSVVARHILEGVGLYCTHIAAIGKDGVDVVAFVRRDSDSDVFSEGGFGKSRGDGTAFACRCRHHVVVDGELYRNSMASANVRKSVGVRNFHGFAVHKQTADVPACFGSYRIGGVSSARNDRVTVGCDRAVALDNGSRNGVFIDGKGGGQRVAIRHVVEGIGRV